MNYYLYTPYSYTFRAAIKRALKCNRIGYKNVTWQKYWADMLKKDHLLGTDLSAPILIIEDSYLQHPLCVLPETYNLVEQILDTNFEGQVTALKPVSESFTIAVPKEKRFNGQLIKGLFVANITCNRYQSMLNEFNDRHDTDTHTILLTANDYDDQILTIAYNDPDSSEMIVISSQLSNFKKILTAKTAQEFKQYGEFGIEAISQDLSQREYETQFEIVRFVIGFIVYMSAHPECLCDEKSIKMPASSKDSPKYLVKKAKQFKPKGTVKPHYRNLRDERFYRHEWEDWPKGSRWVPVNMETIQVMDSSDG